MYKKHIEKRRNIIIFSVAKLISTLSSGMTLLPGDIIANGTPEGVGTVSYTHLDVYKRQA